MLIINYLLIKSQAFLIFNELVIQMKNASEIPNILTQNIHFIYFPSYKLIFNISNY